MAAYKSLSKDLDVLFPPRSYWCDECEEEWDDDINCDCAYWDAYELQEQQIKDSL